MSKDEKIQYEMLRQYDQKRFQLQSDSQNKG